MNDNGRSAADNYWVYGVQKIAKIIWKIFVLTVGADFILRDKNFNDFLLPVTDRLVDFAASFDNQTIATNYQTLVDFELPPACESSVVRRAYSHGYHHVNLRNWKNIVPQKLSELKENNTHHFIYYFGNALGNCWSFIPNITLIDDAFASLNGIFHPDKSEFSEEDYSTKTMEVAKNFLNYRQNFNKVMTRQKKLFNQSMKFLLATLSVIIAYNIGCSIYSSLLKKELEDKLPIPSPDELLTLKKKSQQLLEDQSIFNYLQPVIIYLIVMNFFFEDYSKDKFWFFHLTAFLSPLFFIKDEFFTNELLKIKMRQVERDFSKLKKILTDAFKLEAKDPTKYLQYQAFNLPDRSMSYLQLQVDGVDTITVNQMTIMVRLALKFVQIAYKNWGNHVVLKSHTPINQQQQGRLKAEFFRLCQNCIRLNQIKMQFHELIKIFENHSKKEDYIRLEHGLLSDQKLQSTFCLHSNKEPILTYISSIFTDLAISVKVDNQQLMVTRNLPFNDSEFSVLLRKFKQGFSFSTKTNPETHPPHFKILKIRKKSLDMSDFAEIKIPKPVSSAVVRWERHSYPHPDIQPISGAVNRFIVFNLPVSCFDNNEMLRKRYQAKATQMARSYKGSQGIKHSNYMGYNYHSGVYELFPANIKLCGSQANNRILLSIHYAENGEMLYETCAYAKGVH